MSKIKTINIKSTKNDECVATKFGTEMYFNRRMNIATRQYGNEFDCELRYKVYRKVLIMNQRLNFYLHKRLSNM